MAQSCNKDDLATAASCFMGMPPIQLKATQIALLCALITGTILTCEKNSLADAAKCYMGMSPIQQDAVIVYLLCQLAAGGGGGSTILTGSGSPVGVVTPSVSGQLYTDTTTPALWVSTGTTNTSWTQLI